MSPRTEDGCIKCGACQAVCPVLRLEGYQNFQGPRRLTIEAPRFSRELAALSSQLQMCTSCAMCESACPSRLPITEAVIRMRSRHGARSEGGERMLANVRRYGRAIAPASTVRAPKEGSTLFFPGCVGDARVPSTIQGAVDLLLSSGARAFIPERWYCCGSPLDKIGARDEAEKLRDLNAAMLEGVDEVVTACPGCAVQLQKANGVEVLHVLEYLYELVTPARLRWESVRPIAVALHSPCHLVRSVGPHTMDYARELLSSVPGVKVVDMNDEGCCGGGGGVASALPGLAERMARRRMESAARAGAELVLTPCPFCQVNLGRAGGVESRELIEFLSHLSRHLR